MSIDQQISSVTTNLNTGLNGAATLVGNGGGLNNGLVNGDPAAAAAQAGLQNAQMQNNFGTQASFEISYLLGPNFKIMNFSCLN